jgi:uncharacterized protein with HEPN domain
MSSRPPRLQDCLAHVIEAIDRIGRYTAGIDEAEFVRNEMRNALAHGYFKVDLGIVWKTIETDLPALRQQVEVLLAAPQTSATTRKP